MVVGHVSPEAAAGGALAIVEEGDSITIDASAKSLTLNVPNEDIERRLKAWQKPAPRYNQGVQAKFANYASSSSTGAVLDYFPDLF